MDLITRPANQKFVGTIHLHGEAREQEIREANEKEKHDWQSRIVVDDVQFRTHRCLPTTELTNKGNKASNPLAKLENILKDPPQKFSLREHGLKLDKMPALSTVTNGLSDRDTSGHKETDKDGGYNPGPFQDRSWRIETNRIPCRSDIRGRAKDDKHQDFR